MAIKMIDINEIEQLKNEHVQTEKTYYAVERKFPHIITKHPSAHDTEDKRVFSRLQDAFVARRKMSKHYKAFWKSFTEFDKHRNRIAYISHYG